MAPSGLRAFPPTPPHGMHSPAGARCRLLQGRGAREVNRRFSDYFKQRGQPMRTMLACVAVYTMFALPTPAAAEDWVLVDYVHWVEVDGIRREGPTAYYRVATAAFDANSPSVENIRAASVRSVNCETHQAFISSGGSWVPDNAMTDEGDRRGYMSSYSLEFGAVCRGIR